MRDAKRWLVWTLRPDPQRPDKPKKVPHYADGGLRGKTDTPDDAARLVTYAKAVKALSGSRYAGLGFALGGGWQGLDLDGVRDPATGALEPWALEIVKAIDTYSEVSPSGRGVHLIGRGTEALKTIKKDKAGVEFYTKGRFFTYTGVPINGKASTNIVTLAPIYSLAEKRWLSQAEAHAPNLPLKAGGSPRALWFETREKLKVLLGILTNTDEYDPWLTVGMVLHKESGGSEEGFAMWVRWSQASTKFKHEACVEKWNSFKADEGGVGIGTLIQDNKDAYEKALRDQAKPAVLDIEDDPLVAHLRAGGRVDFSSVKEVEFYIDGLIERRRSVGLVAPGGTGKTTLVLDLAIATALGTEWLGMQVQQGAFVLISKDDLKADLDGAFKSMVEARGLSDKDAKTVLDNVHLFSLLELEKAGLLDFADESNGTPAATQLKERLIAGLRDIKNVRCVMLDTLRQFAGGDTNSSRVMGIATQAVTSLAATLDCVAIVPHHTTKVGAREGTVDQYTGSGSAAFGDNLRVILVLFKSSVQEMQDEISVPHEVAAALVTSEVLKLTDTRGSLRRRALPPIWIARDRYAIRRVDGRPMAHTERDQRDIEQVVAAVKAGAGSGDSVATALKWRKQRAAAAVRAALESGAITKEPGRTGKLKTAP